MMDCFRAVWGCDFEYNFPHGDGSLPNPICCTFRELRTGQEIRLWGDELRRPCPVTFNRDVLFVAFFASAEFSCFLQLGWPIPTAVFDCYVEFRCLTNGRPTATGFNGLSDALIEFKLPPIVDKKSMRDLALRGAPYSDEERAALQNYNAEDTVALARLFPELLLRCNLAQAINRGRYMRAVANVERSGVPLDVDYLQRLNERWDDVKLGVIRAVDAFGLYEGASFRADKLERLIRKKGIVWPRYPDGRLKLDSRTFRAMANALSYLRSVYELRETMAKLHTRTLSVGPDGRNRAMLSPFRSRTARNQPSNSQFIYGNASWTRGLIKPCEGWGIAYIDWGQQEFAIAAALSGDTNMIRAYQSGDPYLGFAKLAGAVPANATKQSHKQIRDQYKATTLAIQYGMSYESLADRIGASRYTARELLGRHQLSFPGFWRWSEQTCNNALLTGQIESVHGWRMHCGTHDRHIANSGTGYYEQNLRSLMNWPMQTSASDMMRLAMSILTENGVRVIAPVHDAFLIEAPLAELDDVIDYAARVMRAVSAEITGELVIGVDKTVVRSPGRYMDDRGAAMWRRVRMLVDGLGD